MFFFYFFVLSMVYVFFFFFFFFFFNDTATTEIYTLSLHDALPISVCRSIWPPTYWPPSTRAVSRSEEHTSELQSHSDLVCRLLLEKKKKHKKQSHIQKKKKKKQHKQTKPRRQ